MVEIQQEGGSAMAGLIRVERPAAEPVLVLQERSVFGAPSRGPVPLGPLRDNQPVKVMVNYRAGLKSLGGSQQTQYHHFTYLIRVIHEGDVDARQLVATSDGQRIVDLRKVLP